MKGKKEMNKKQLMMTANESYEEYGTTRAWLRSKAEQGKIRLSVLAGRNSRGEEFIKKLYLVEDIERELKFSK